MATNNFLDLNGVLNQLAGTTDLEATLAANIWAGLTTKGQPNSGRTLDLIGALNVKNGSWANPLHRLDLDGVCNALAGLSGSNTLDAIGALNHLAGNHR